MVVSVEGIFRNLKINHNLYLYKYLTDHWGITLAAMVTLDLYSGMVLLIGGDFSSPYVS